MHTIRSVGVLSVAKIFGAIYFAMSLIFVPFLFLMIALGAMANANTRNGPFGAFGVAGMGIFALILPVFYGVIGFVAGAIGAFVYNLLAKWMGGIQIHLEPSGAALAGQPLV